MNNMKLPYTYDYAIAITELVKENIKKMSSYYLLFVCFLKSQ